MRTRNEETIEIAHTGICGSLVTIERSVRQIIHEEAAASAQTRKLRPQVPLVNRAAMAVPIGDPIPLHGSGPTAAS